MFFKDVTSKLPQIYNVATKNKKIEKKTTNKVNISLAPASRCVLDRPEKTNMRERASPTVTQLVQECVAVIPYTTQYPWTYRSKVLARLPIQQPVRKSHATQVVRSDDATLFSGRPLAKMNLNAVCQLIL